MPEGADLQRRQLLPRRRFAADGPHKRPPSGIRANAFRAHRSSAIRPPILRIDKFVRLRILRLPIRASSSLRTDPPAGAGLFLVERVRLSEDEATSGMIEVRCDASLSHQLTGRLPRRPPPRTAPNTAEAGVVKRGPNSISAGGASRLRGARRQSGARRRQEVRKSKHRHGQAPPSSGLALFVRPKAGRRAIEVGDRNPLRHRTRARRAARPHLRWRLPAHCRPLPAGLRLRLSLQDCGRCSGGRSAPDRSPRDNFHRHTIRRLDRLHNLMRRQTASDVVQQELLGDQCQCE